MIKWIKKWWKKYIVSTREEAVDIWLCEKCREKVCTEEMRRACIDRMI